MSMITGLALFVSRRDGAEIEKKEQASIVKLVSKHAKALKIESAEGEKASPSVYDYGSYEKKGLGVLLYEDAILGEMPDDIREDHENAGKTDAMKIAKAIDKDAPRTYSFKAYYVEV
jgi:hypothetical protein